MLACLDEPMGPGFFVFFNPEITIGGGGKGNKGKLSPSRDKELEGIDEEDLEESLILMLTVILAGTDDGE